MGEALLLALSFAVILAGARLFTTAVEWAGHRLDLAEGATGSLLAAVGTAMPETLIPIVAIVGGSSGADDVAIGAIIGAPFLLATIAMAVVGISALIYRGRRAQGTRLPRRHPGARPRPRLLRSLLRRRPWARVGRARRGADSMSPIGFVFAYVSTSVVPYAAVVPPRMSTR